jgi:glycosyltransferase involved in cell wall biosynthesis
MNFIVEKIIILVSLVVSILYLFSIRSRLLYSKYRSLPFKSIGKISVIIPARNEETNIEKLLKTLIKQSIELHEIIIVNDNSSDNTANIVEHFSKKSRKIKLINLLEEPPEGWTGKSWALWNGVKNSSGDLLLFLDADVELDERAIEILVQKYNESGDVISVWPYQRFECFYEHLTLAANLLIVYSSKNFPFLGNKPAGLFGPVIFTSRDDYIQIGGHKAVRESILEDLKLGKQYLIHGKKIDNYLGNGLIKFRMYPGGIKQLFEGYTKNMASGSIFGGFWNFIAAFLWMFGIYLSIFRIFDSLWNLLIYITYIFIILILSKPLGDYKWYDFLFYPVHFLFFLSVFIFSIFETVFLKQVSWKGRKISVQR